MTARRLTIEIAKRFLEGEQGIDMSQFSRIDDAAAKAFIYREAVLNLDGLRTLSEASFRAVAKFEGQLSLRGLKSISTAKALLDGWLVHYNFFRTHESLDDKTPAIVAGIKLPYRNWLDVIEGQRLVITETETVELPVERHPEKIKNTSRKTREGRKSKTKHKQGNNISMRGIRKQ